jgi:hypothetical protein
MAAVFSGQNIGVVTAGGIDLAASGNTFSFEITNDKVDAGLIARLGKHNQPIKTSGKLTVDLASVVSGSTRVSHMNVTAFTIGGVSYLNVLRSFSLSGSFEHRMQAGTGEKYTKPQVTAKDYQVAINLDIESTDSYTLMNFLGGADFTANAKTVSITINSVVITIPLNLNQGTINAQRYELQELALSFDGADPGAGNYPTAPTGTTTILEKALNAPTTEIAFVFQNALTGVNTGVRGSGNAVFESFSIKTQDAQLVEENYSFATYGTITIAASS